MFNKLIAISLIGLLTGCCSMQNKKEPVWITSTPDQAEVTIDGHYCGMTPVCVDLNKKYDHFVSLSKEGHQGCEGMIPSKRTFRSAKNLIWPAAGAVIGTGIGLACYGTGGFIIPQFIIGTVIGTGVGMGIGSVGLGVDCISRADCTLPTQFHGELLPQ